MARAASRLVLVVEDEPLLRMDAVDMIREAGFDVLEASNADEAILLLETRLDIEVVFTDIDMPGSMNGIKLAHAVRNRWPPITIIATSGHFKVRDGDLPTDVRFLPKPYTYAGNGRLPRLTGRLVKKQHSGELHCHLRIRCALRKGGNFLSSASPRPALCRASILVVDDEGLVRFMVAEELRDQGYSVLEAASGAAAARLLYEGAQVDLVFTDVRMPGSIDGIALAHLVNSEFSGIKVIIASGHIFSLPVGLADGFFSKPYDLASVAAKIETVLKAPSGVVNRGPSAGTLLAHGESCAAE
jgi:CheY-like chemotaxis protein